MLINNTYVNPRAITVSWPFLVLWLLVVVLYKCRTGKKWSDLSVIAVTIFSFYITKVMSMTMLPVFVYHFWYVGDMFGFGHQFDAIHLNPLRALDYFPSWFWFEQFFGNFIMLTPFGMMAPYVLPKLRKFWQVGLVGFAISLSIETYQLVFSYLYITARYFETSDLILNTSGALLGFGIWWLIVNHSKRVNHLYQHRLNGDTQTLHDLFKR